MIRETQQEFHCNDGRPGCDARDDDPGLSVSRRDSSAKAQC